MKKERHNYTAEEKIMILKRHLLDHVSVSDPCDEYRLQPKLFYNWQKQLFENGAAAFKNETDNPSNQQHKRVQELEDKLKRKHEVLSELMEEHIRLKKELGEL